MIDEELIEQVKVLTNGLMKNHDIALAFISEKKGKQEVIIRFSELNDHEGPEVNRLGIGLCREFNLQKVMATTGIFGGTNAYHHESFELYSKFGSTHTNVFIEGSVSDHVYIIMCKEVSENTPPKRELITTYKYFKEKRFKDQFLNGQIWLGTLYGFRELENPNQGDKLEGKTLYHISTKLEQDEITELQKTNPDIGNLFHSPHGGLVINFENTEIHTSSLDCYVVCSTNNRNDELFKDDFGEHCVKIIDCLKFFILVKHALSQKFDSPFEGDAGEVEYSKITETDINQHHDHIFTKPEKQYAWQDEFRFCWYPPSSHRSIAPFSLDIGSDLVDGLFEDVTL